MKTLKMTDAQYIALMEAINLHIGEIDFEPYSKQDKKRILLLRRLQFKLYKL